MARANPKNTGEKARFLPASGWPGEGSSGGRGFGFSCINALLSVNDTFETGLLHQT